MEEIITQIETQNSLDYLDLFEFNGYNPPKFWFGDRVKCFSHSHMTGTVLGLEWRDGEKVLARDGSENGGWWYRICLDGRQSLMGFYEDSLEQIGE
jgi:hypothetical protein